MFMFLLYVLVLYICSIGGSFYLKENKKLLSIKNIIGFCTYLGTLQIIYYPLQYFKVGSVYFHIVTGIITIIFFILGSIHIKKEDFSIFKKYEFWIILVLVFVIIKIIPGMEAGDDSFYMALFMDNADISKINSIDPRTGLLGNIDSVYLYQGYYNLMSFIYKMQSLIFKSNINNIFVSFRSTMSLLSVIFSAQVLVNLKEKYKNKDNRRIYPLIQILSILLIAVLEWCHIYWGSFMLFQIYIPAFMIIFSMYLEDNKYKYTLAIINLAAISLASSSLFLFAFITFGYFLYEAIKKQVKCEDYAIILAPSIIYVAFLFNKLWLIPIYGLLVIGLFLFEKQISKIINSKLIYAVFLLPIIFFILGKMGDYLWGIETYRVGKPTVLYSLALVCYTIYLKIKKEDISPILFVAAVISVFFFNPLVQPFVSHHFTSTYVYYRLFYIIKSPVVVTVFFLSIYDVLRKKKKFYVPAYIGLLLILIANYGYHLCKDTILLDNYNIPYNYLLREDKYSHELGEELIKLPDNTKIFSVYFAPRIYNKELNTDVARYPYDSKWDRNVLVSGLYKDYDFPYDEYDHFNREVNNNNYQYLITYNDDSMIGDIDDEDYTIVYQNNMYVLIESKSLKTN